MLSFSLRLEIGKRIYRRKTLWKDGIVWYPIGVFALMLFLGYPGRAAAAWGILGAGDLLASVLGRHFGKRKLPWNPRKSVIGAAGFIVGATLAGAAYARWSGVLETRTDFLVLGVSVLAAALVESLPTKIDDNVRITTALIVVGRLLARFSAPAIRN